MSEPIDSSPPGADSLQFDHVEPASHGGADPGSTPAADACSICHGSLLEEYYRIGGKPVCASCKLTIERQILGTGGARTVFRAILWGVGGGALGAGIYYGIREVTGYEIGLIAMVVGLLVGGAVRKACGGRGGVVYQGLAVFLTYLSIGTTYLPPIYSALKKNNQERLVQKTAATRTSSAASAAGEATATAEIGRPPATAPRMAFGLALIYLCLMAFAGAMIAPVMVGFEAPMSFIILAIALYEAWRINKRPAISFVGPIRVSAWGAPDP
jgi:hypothetical protein